MRRILLILPILLAACTHKSMPPTMSIKTVPEQLFLCVAEDVTQGDIPAFAERAIDPLYHALEAAQLESAGDLNFICPVWNRQGKFQLIIAIPIKKDGPVPAPYYTWTAPAFQCASVEFTGSMPELGAQGWPNLIQQTKASGHQPGNSWREVYKHWEAFDSPKDVTELQLEIQ